MFATLIGPYPQIDGDAHARLVATIGDQLEAGLGMLSDGLLHDPRTTSPAAIVRAWQAADVVGRELATAAGIEPPLIKACLTGPWSAGYRDARSVTRHVRPAIASLFDAGAPVVQLTESTLGDIDPADESLLDQLGSGLDAVTAGVDGHLSLAVAGGRPTRVPFERLFAAPFASYLFDLIRSPDDWNLCARAPATSGLVVGVGDARTTDPDTEAVSVWGARYAASLGGRGTGRVGLAMSAGLESLPREIARAKLTALAEAGRKADLSGEELAKVIDPRAVDARSAALGRYEPPRPRP